jgi:hypothetical protein
MGKLARLATAGPADFQNLTERTRMAKSKFSKPTEQEPEPMPDVQDMTTPEQPEPAVPEDVPPQPLPTPDAAPFASPLAQQLFKTGYFQVSVKDAPTACVRASDAAIAWPEYCRVTGAQRSENQPTVAMITEEQFNAFTGLKSKD